MIVNKVLQGNNEILGEKVPHSVFACIRPSVTRPDQDQNCNFMVLCTGNARKSAHVVSYHKSMLLNSLAIPCPPIHSTIHTNTMDA